MGEVTLPLWGVIILAGLSLLLILDRLLVPGIRWYFRRRANRLIDEINTRLDIEIRPFQLNQRHSLIDQLVFDEEVNKALLTYAQENNLPREVAQDRVRQYAKEIVPSFNAYIYFRVGYWLARRIARLIYRVRVAFFDDDRIADIDPEATVVFVMNHRSNMDYILVSFLAAEKTALSYAVGEWARIWPLQTLIRAMGAFFVRRNSDDPLYRRVLERYVHMATRAGVCQAVFLEGGLSKDGALREPRLGFIDYMLRNYHPETDRDIVFVPVGINYDRVIEDRSLLRRLDPAVSKRSAWFVIKTSLKFLFKHLKLSRRNRWRRFGYAGVNFGKPVSVRQYCKDNKIAFSDMQHDIRFKAVDVLSSRLMSDIQEIIPILPVALMSQIVLDYRPDWKSELEIKRLALDKIEDYRKRGAPINIAPNACEGVLSTAMTMLISRRMLDEKDGLFRASDSSLDILSYYANSIKSAKRTA
ncbi:MAG: 1-acyl-sn-glycerol-3-phosphate acyltransferase [Gammaproteobacteria bacterium]